MTAIEQLAYWEAVIDQMQERLVNIRRESANLREEKVEVLKRLEEAMRAQAAIIEGNEL